jgi:hypothetical protein
MASSRTLIPVYTTRGDLGAFLAYPYLYNPSGEWIGWVTPEREVFSVHGSYIGYLTKDPRILRKRAESGDHSRRTPPLSPGKITPPARVPLPPMMPEIRLDTIDVLDEAPELMPTVDFGEERMDIE